MPLSSHLNRRGSVPSARSRSQLAMAGGRVDSAVLYCACTKTTDALVGSSAIFSWKTASAGPDWVVKARGSWLARHPSARQPSRA